MIGWVDTKRNKKLASWSFALRALNEANIHQVDAIFFQTQAEKIAYTVNQMDRIPLEEIQNAARHFDAPYILHTPAWLLVCLSQLHTLSTLSAQVKLARINLELIQRDGRVGRIPEDSHPNIYSAFNVFFALKAFSLAHSGEKLLSNLIYERQAFDRLTRGARRSRATVFIGSSLEGLEVARAIQQNFEKDSFDCVIWEQSISNPTQTVIESLENATSEYDFAILVLTPDDFELSRGFIKPAIRDNVLFELGLFMGALGRSRVFGIHPRGNFKMPSDLLGLIFVDYDVNRFEFNPQASVSSACQKIRTQMKYLGAK